MDWYPASELPHISGMAMAGMPASWRDDYGDDRSPGRVKDAKARTSVFETTGLIGNVDAW